MLVWKLLLGAVHKLRHQFYSTSEAASYLTGRGIIGQTPFYHAVSFLEASLSAWVKMCKLSLHNRVESKQGVEFVLVVQIYVMVLDEQQLNMEENVWNMHWEAHRESFLDFGQIEVVVQQSMVGISTCAH